ncbi:Alpha/beta hydrolase family protein [Anatilimnocola aggregata]|uniref:Alpha/beta hydrolase family protein n=1 Tax=Anatilimnocola aggregata TaxID=2528021 RepID=A0A517YEQ9_9BACT|nr:peptidase [Anatilimnocola aggregata]QDU28707.1 Alpha/beta hydrolase family protein [Anatilimnocola aggregata]
MHDRRLSQRTLLVLLMVSFYISPPSVLAEVITLKNGLRIEGKVDKLGNLGANPLQGNTVGDVATKEIVIIDDDLRRVFVGQKQVLTFGDSPLSSFERIKLQQAVASAGPGIASVGPIVKVTPFDKYGRRIFTMAGNKGNIDVIQGITEITPRYTKVEALTRGSYQYVWSMQVATTSIPRETLSEILMHRIDPKNPEQRLSIVKLYLQAQRIQDARTELEAIIRDFPNLANLQDQVKALRQTGANMLLKEIQLRRDAGQHQLAISMLTNYPAEGVAGESQLKARDMLAEYDDVKAKGERVLALMSEHASQIKAQATRDRVQPICNEIATEMNIHSLARMADYLRLSDDDKTSAEQKLSLAISGWLMGSGSGIDNLAVTLSLVQVRDKVRAYLLARRKADRDVILAEIQSLEGSTPEYIAKILAHMKPPLETYPKPKTDIQTEPEKPAAPAAVPVVAPVAPAPAAPAPAAIPPAAGAKGNPLDLLNRDLRARPAPPGALQVNKVLLPEPVDDRDGTPVGAQATVNGISGLLKIQTPGLSEDPIIDYYVQLPPEYDPYRRYPCVISLNGAGTTPLQQVDWWAGPHSGTAAMRYGQATRHGYIVIAPVWTREHQREYEYSAREHAAVLYTLRDASRRFAVDTDQVFLSGHSMGADAAWDIGLAHPDLWAGVMPIVARGDKYISRYSENGRNLPMYFVCGEKDGDKWQNNSPDWERYLKYVGYDSLVVQYQGRGHEHFHDEIQNLFEWMNLHQRNFFPKKFAANTLRPWDNFFWYVEMDRMPPVGMVLPIQWPPGRGVIATKVEASILPTNGISVDSSAAKITVWLSPDMINFNAKPFVSIRGKRFQNIQPDVSVLLEDVRTRGDRQHPFWAKVSNVQ